MPDNFDSDSSMNHAATTPIPLVDLATQSQAIKQDVLRRMDQVIDAGRYILGQEVQEFEQQFASYCQTKSSVGLANGTDAIHLALRALGIGPGDEVITAGNSFAATAFAIAYAGATPVFVDVDEVDFNLDPSLLEAAITERTKAIIPVHLYGQPARMPEILEIARRHQLLVVEDAAQAHGAEIDGKRCGSFGQAGCFSFYPGKNLGAFGDGGATVTDSTEVLEQLQLLRNYGQKVKNQHDQLGYNCRLDTLQACVLLAKLQHIERWTEQRRQVADWYREELLDMELTLPVERSDVRHVYHLFVVRHPERDRIIEHLKTRNIFCGIHYPNPLSQAQPFSDCVTVPLDLPVVSRLATEIFSLPMYPEMTREQVSRVGQEIRSFLPAKAVAS